MATASSLSSSGALPTHPSGTSRTQRSVGSRPSETLRERLRVPHGGGTRRGARRRYPWAALLQRAYGIEVLACPNCSGMRRVLAAIHDPASIVRVLGAMGLSPEVPELAACRTPPVGEAFGGDREVSRSDVGSVGK